MRQILLISFLFVLSSCSVFRPTHSADNQPETVFSVDNHYFSQLNEEHIFRANLTFFKKEISGFLVIKKTDDHMHRVVLTSDFGNTLVDFSIFENAPYQVNFVMPDLDRKMILNFLAEDFQIALHPSFEMNEKLIDNLHSIFKGKFKKRKSLSYKIPFQITFKKSFCRTKENLKPDFYLKTKTIPPSKSFMKNHLFKWSSTK